MDDNQSKPEIDPWITEYVNWPEHRYVAPEEQVRMLRKVIDSMNAIARAIGDRSIARAHVELEFRSELDDENISYEFTWPKEDNEA